MRQLVYISTGSPDLTEEDVADILATSQRKNPQRGLTGFLIYNGRNFLQLLEGDAAAIEILMADLRQDRRHNGLVRIEDVAIDVRRFSDWTMRRFELSADVDARRAELTEWLPDGFDDKVLRTVLNFASLN